MRRTHRRRSIRLPGHDYSQPGAYFVTICTRDRECLFGQAVRDEVRLNPLGHIASACLAELPSHFPDVELDEWVVMPNHVHVIVIIGSRGTACRAPTNDCRAHILDQHAISLPRRFGKPISGALSTVVGAFKAATTRRINAMRGTPGAALWQRNYYEHVIRTEAELRSVREYIALNPLAWKNDEENPDRT